jgi:outer membrane murein-binding lipoprotein Lpp
LAIPAALLAIALLVGGCGGSSKPDYCSNVSDLQGSVDELSSVKLESGALETVKADLEKIQSNANAVVSSAKQDFPNETSTLKSSVSKLSATVNQLPPTPTPQQLVGLGAEIQSTVTAAQELSSATESACE